MCQSVIEKGMAKCGLKERNLCRQAVCEKKHNPLFIVGLTLKQRHCCPVTPQLVACLTHALTRGVLYNRERSKEGVYLHRRAVCSMVLGVLWC